MISLIQNPGSAGQVFNVGHTKDISIGELAQLVKKLTHSRSEIIHVPFDEAYESAGFEDMARRLPDISKLRELIGYRPTLDLPQMLDAIVAQQRVELGLDARHRMLQHLIGAPRLTPLPS
jgi:UDP-glucose 4-epimerase